MRRTVMLVATLLATLGLATSPALAMQPPGEPAQEHFGCVDGSPVPGHPGAAGLVHATPLVGGLTSDPLPTAWNAVEHAEPITSSCA